MKPLKATCVAAVAIIALVAAYAQDGWLGSATPPLIVRYDAGEIKWHFTNTSDKMLFGVALTMPKSSSKTIIIDSIEPNKTVTVSIPSELLDSSIICKDYTKPMPLFGK